MNSESNLVLDQGDVRVMPAVGVCGFAGDAEEGAEEGDRIGSLVVNRGNSKMKQRGIKMKTRKKLIESSGTSLQFSAEG